MLKIHWFKAKTKIFRFRSMFVRKFRTFVVKQRSILNMQKMH